MSYQYGCLMFFRETKVSILENFKSCKEGGCFCGCVRRRCLLGVDVAKNNVMIVEREVRSQIAVWE